MVRKSVAAEVWRPTGPMAAEASTPTLSVPFNKFCTLCGVRKTRMRSVACTPIW